MILTASNRAGDLKVKTRTISVYIVLYPDSFKQDLSADFDEVAIDSVTYQQWISTNSAALKRIVKGVGEFCDTLMNKLVQLEKHDSIANEQSSFLKTKRSRFSLES